MKSNKLNKILTLFCLFLHWSFQIYWKLLPASLRMTSFGLQHTLLLLPVMPFKMASSPVISHLVFPEKPQVRPGGLFKTVSPHPFLFDQA